MYCYKSLFWSFSVYPSGARNLYIGVGDAAYNLLDASVASHLSKCNILLGPVAIDTDLEIQCQPGASGRFLYVYMEYFSIVSTNDMHVREIQIYGCLDVEARM